MTKNPYTISFGKKPMQYISRISQTEEILENFQEENPSNQIYMITGVRGAGKTVLLTTIASELSQEKNWICVELNPEVDLLHGLAAKLYAIPELQKLFLSVKLDFSALGFGATIENGTQICDDESAVSMMLDYMTQKGKRLLITLDEVTTTEYVKIFMHSFQIFLRQDYNVFLLMTGLYDNIQNLQNNKTLTFLYRAPKIVLEPLNYTAVRQNYMDTFAISLKEAEELAMLTKGYSFAFQVLGHLCWKQLEAKGRKIEIRDVLETYDQYLADYVFGKICDELSEVDMQIVRRIADCESNKVKDIREGLEMDSAKFSVYRDRLKRKGIIGSRQYGTIEFQLPRFAEYVRRNSVNYIEMLEEEDWSESLLKEEGVYEGGQAYDHNTKGKSKGADFEMVDRERMIEEIEGILKSADEKDVYRVYRYVKRTTLRRTTL